MPTSYAEVYFPVLVQVLIAVAVATGLIGVSYLLGKKVKNKAKDTPYESGIVPTGNANERFSVKFYLVAMLFILFDIEVVFLFPWAVVYRDLARESRMFPFIEMFVFITLVLAGFFYIWKKGALDWAAEEIEKVRRPEQARVEETPTPELVAHD
jgi:NADH-quinone oxidoreductase subunit A